MVSSDDSKVHAEMTPSVVAVKDGAGTTPPHWMPEAPLPFSLSDIRARIPEHCFERNTATALWYLAQDVAMAVVLYLLAMHVVLPLSGQSWLLALVLLPAYWVVQGTVFTSLWVIAHECGHGAFSPNESISDAIGFVGHSFLLVPYFSWKYTHARHHLNTGNVDRDEVFVPPRRSEMAPERMVPTSTTYRAFILLFIAVLGWPSYLLYNVSGPKKTRGASHFWPSSPLFLDSERSRVALSNAGIAAMVLLLLAFAWTTSLWTMLAVYFVPYLVTNFWLVSITALHHSDYHVPHYGGDDWTWLRGALCTIDRDYGIVNVMLHNITDTHVVHHIFPRMPHYHAKEATRAVRPLLGAYYFEDHEPFYSALWRFVTECTYVEDEGSIFWWKSANMPDFGPGTAVKTD